MVLNLIAIFNINSTIKFRTIKNKIDLILKIVTVERFLFLQYVYYFKDIKNYSPYTVRHLITLLHMHARK